MRWKRCCTPSEFEESCDELEDEDFESDFFFQGHLDSEEEKTKKKERLFDSKTGEMLPLWTQPSESTMNYNARIMRQPYRRSTGLKLKWGTPYGPDVIPWNKMKYIWPCNKYTGKPVSMEEASKTKTIPYGKVFSTWPCDKRTGKRFLQYDTPRGPNVIPYYSVKARELYDPKTGKKLPWGESKINRGVVKKDPPYSSKAKNKSEPQEMSSVMYGALRNRWPYDKNTAKKLEIGTPLGGDVVSYSTIKSNWPYNKYTGEKLKWGTPIDQEVVPYHILYSSYHRIVADSGERIYGLNAIIETEKQGKKFLINKVEKSNLLVYEQEGLTHRRGSPVSIEDRLNGFVAKVKRSTLQRNLKKEGENSLVYLGGSRSGYSAAPEHKLGDKLVINGEAVEVVTATSEYLKRKKEPRYAYFI